ncbi:metallophosphoesterase [Candidatus Woesearchaeota archaeon]|nr:metallophosphoesterase [Candidatus Woesearchaeota archaeon]
MIGIISDTHDNIDSIRKAVSIFKTRKVEFVIHCGDIIAPATVKYFESLKMKFIFGNCDGNRSLILKRVEEIKGEHHGRIMEIKHRGKSICAVHGDNQGIFEKALGQGYDYLLHGHTHIPEDRKIKDTRVLCPGGHYLGDPKERNQVIILDLEKDNVEFINVNSEKA